MKTRDMINVICAAMIGAILGTTVVTVYKAQEDDKFANCYIYGDGHCGEGSAWHGFVNF